MEPVMSIKLESQSPSSSISVLGPRPYRQAFQAGAIFCAAELTPNCQRDFTERQPGSRSSASMDQDKKDNRPKRDLDIEATTALDLARALPPGPERTEAMKRAGILRNAADMQGLFFAKRGRPAKT